MNTNALISSASFLKLFLLTFFISLVLSLSAASASGATFTVTKTADTSDGVCSADCSLREAVLAANAINSDEVINFDPAVFGAFTTITLTAGEISIEDRGSLTINGTGASHLTITSNLASRIFGMFDGPFANGSVTLNNMTIAQGNSAPNFTGGCIFNDSVDLNINNSIIRDCRAGSGAGIFNNAGLITIANSAFTGNIAEAGSGAAIFNGASDPDGGLIVTNSTFAGNHATNEGGAIETSVGRHTQLTNVTIAFNSAGDGGGVHNSFGQAVTTVRNTIIAQNSATLTAPDAWGEITSQGYNLIQNTSGTTILGDTTGNITGQNPLLGPVQANGGQMPTTALASGSPAIDTADPANVLLADARGVPRPLDGDSNGTARADMGAFEAGARIVTKTADTNDGTCDSDCSLREAITAANSTTVDDAILFSSLFNFSQNITLGGTQLAISNNGKLTINGPGTILTIDGNSASRVFYVAGSANAAINALTITRGRLLNNDWGAGILNEGTLAVNNITVTNNSTASNGGGIMSSGGSASLTINNSDVYDNFGNGGGVYNFQGTAAINNTVIRNNVGSNGAGILNVSGPMTLTNVTVSSNFANSGGIGGGILNSSGTLTAAGLAVTSNAGKSGGGIYNDAGTLNISSSQISGNVLVAGGNEAAGIFTRVGTATLNNVTISGNIACTGCVGGAISVWQFGAVLNLNNVTISSNTAAAAGGIWVQNSATANITNSSIVNNTGISGGGGILVSDGIANLTNTTVARNNVTATGFNGGGGGGLLVGSGTANIVNSTIAGNTTASTIAGSGIRNGKGTAIGTVNLRNSIVADNIAAGSPDADISGPINSEGHNLIENTTGGTITGTTTGNILGQDPGLMQLANYGGPTLSMGLQPFSPAIDRADPSNFPAADQRGILRPQDGDLNGTLLPDIGSYERQVNILTVSKSADTDDGTCNADCSLREAIAASVAAALPDSIITFSAGFFSTPRTITLAASRGELRINRTGSLIIDALGANLLTINGNSQNRVFLVQSGAYAVLNKMTITGGNGNSSIDNGAGGGVMIAGGWLNINNSVVRNNAGNVGGGITAFNGFLILNASTVRNNSTAFEGGGLNIQLTSPGISSVINNSAIIMNTAPLSGGGVYGRGPITIDGSNIADNSAGETGGGVSNGGGVMNMTRSSVTGNTAALNGGGISSFDNLIVSSSTIAGNISQSNGGGIYSQGVLNLSNSTVAANLAAGNGGGVYNTVGTASLHSATVAGNSADAAGGGFFNAFGAGVSIRNSIFSDNTAATHSPDYAGVLGSAGYNLIENTSGTTISGITTGNITGLDPKLGLLAVNGGPTLTKALLPGSPALDTGDPTNSLPTDQRGVVRPKDGERNGTVLADIGAFERDPALDRTPFDYDGDGKADISVFRPSEGNWYVQNSGDGSVTGLHFGQINDLIAPGDFDGDGKADISVFRPSEGNWYRLNSSDGSFFGTHFGTAEDKPAVGDFDGDGKDDISVFRPSEGNWYRLNSSDGSFFGTHFGAAEDKPAVGDFDGDGKADISVFRPSEGNWYRLNSSNGSFFGTHFGLAEDKPAVGDFDGDGITDISVYRPSEGNWYRLNSNGGSFFGTHFGLSEDKPVAADFDGDGKADIAVFRPSEGNWYILNSTAGFLSQHFGITEDVPTPNSFVY